jgi:DNA replication protein DnaD
MIAPNLLERFWEMGFDFHEASPNKVVTDKKNQISLEIDYFLENGNKAMLVEMKTKLTTKDVKDHIKRIEKMCMYANLHGDTRSFLGSVAGVVITPQVKTFALEQGLFVIEPSGKTFNITSPNLHKEWP